ncbi:MAG: alanine--glyoxylate aminotransferase family protein [Cyanobacteria bacterium NC_groundwater_1444_Ag_S-0.65um_54_12]|nr:alanine--glyoxylate aminotransferase family protein [Cyanobacteria bacterium NC_groundwater_1444_Ag_S-0.65um_54_12]
MGAELRLMIPGPTTVPGSVLRAMSRPMINHRTAGFSELLQSCTKKLQWLYQTSDEILVLTCSGTGGLEAALVNVLSPGDSVLSLSTGVFGKRFADIAQAYGAVVDRVEWPIGKAYDISRVEEIVSAGKNYQVVLLTHNETSTAILNPIPAIAAVIRRYMPRTLILVDAVSGLGIADLPVERCELDVVVAASQKACMAPPGLAFVSMSARAWEAHGRAKAPRFYFDLGRARSFSAKGQTPWTPAISVLYALEEALSMLQEEGLTEVFWRHELLTKALRAGLRASGLGLLVEDDNIASRAVTAVFPPKGVSPKGLRQQIATHFGIVLAGGQGELADSIFRIGHLGHCNSLDILSVLGALEIVLSEFVGTDRVLGQGVAAAQRMLKKLAQPELAVPGL